MNSNSNPEDSGRTLTCGPVSIPAAGLVVVTGAVASGKTTRVVWPLLAQAMQTWPAQPRPLFVCANAESVVGVNAGRHAFVVVDGDNNLANEALRCLEHMSAVREPLTVALTASAIHSLGERGTAVVATIAERVTQPGEQGLLIIEAQSIAALPAAIRVILGGGNRDRITRIMLRADPVLSTADRAGARLDPQASILRFLRVGPTKSDAIISPDRRAGWGSNLVCLSATTATSMWRQPLVLGRGGNAAMVRQRSFGQS